MAYSENTRRRLAIVLLVVWLPAYLVMAMTFLGMIGWPSVVIAIPIYMLLGVLWILPFKYVLRRDPPKQENAPADQQPDSSSDQK